MQDSTGPLAKHPLPGSRMLRRLDRRGEGAELSETIDLRENEAGGAELSAVGWVKWATSCVFFF